MRKKREELHLNADAGNEMVKQIEAAALMRAQYAAKEQERNRLIELSKIETPYQKSGAKMISSMIKDREQSNAAKRAESSPDAFL